MEDKERETVSFTHQELMDITKTTLGDLIGMDELLKDLPRDITLEEITSQIALEHGQSMNIYVHKDNGEILPIVVPVKATVLDLKKAIRRHINLSLKRSGCLTKISWKHIWKQNTLMCGRTKLEDDNEKLCDLNVGSNSKVTFAKRLKQK